MANNIAFNARVAIDCHAGNIPKKVSVHDVPKEMFDLISTPVESKGGFSWKYVAGITFFLE